MSKEATTRPYLSEAEVAQLFGVAPITIKRMRRRHELPFHRIAGQVRVAKIDVETYLANSRIPRAANRGNRRQTEKQTERKFQ